MDITIVCATRSSKQLFSKETLLGKSLQKPPHRNLNRFIEYQNTRGLSEIYNSAIEKHSNDLLIFCHDDLALPESLLEPVLNKALERYNIVGLAGNCRDAYHFAWHIRPDGLG